MLDKKADPKRSADRVHPQALARAVSDFAADDAVFCVDTGEVTLWTANWLRPRRRQQITGSFNNAAVGVALGMANGIQALDTTRQVIVMCGDGGFCGGVRRSRISRDQTNGAAGNSCHSAGHERSGHRGRRGRPG
jgi:thiamine pyrophosphate-dependent acetolactate synthase large subunit-like protein